MAFPFSLTSTFKGIYPPHSQPLENVSFVHVWLLFAVKRLELPAARGLRVRLSESVIGMQNPHMIFP